MPKEAGGYTIKLTGPGHSFEKPISEDVANRIINLVMIGNEGSNASQSSAHPNAQPAQQTNTGAATGGLTSKQFLAQKKPGNNYERVACLAYYLTHQQKLSSFKTAEITKLNTDAAQPRMSNPALFVRHSTSTYGYLSSAGGGKKQITTLGEAVVEALPDREKVAAAIEEHKPTRKRAKRKTRK